MCQAIAAAMSLSNREIPHYYLATDIDMSRSLGWLEEQNRQRSIRERLLPVVLPLKAVALALGKVPELNAHWVDGQLQMKQAVHIGFVISLRGGGLMTPALHNVDQLSLDQLMAALTDLITRTRSGKLRGSEMTDAGMTVTGLGDLGVRTVYGVIYPPQVALVGLGKIAEQPWVEQGVLSVRSVLTATLADDHRAGDGHQGGRFPLM
ncbi:MAG: 2-oxo acid dehydrogenase subunit E2 [Desulfuromusa sp.]|nr:2-oxo acid dehydrogenase subunit E2 [Desulfuromusa sp.]